MAKKDAGIILKAGLDAQGDYFSAEVLEQAVKESQGRVLPLTIGFDPTKLVGQCSLEWDPIAKGIVMRPFGNIDPRIMAQLEPAADGVIEKSKDDGEQRLIEKFRMTGVGMVAPGQKVKTVESEK